jgi:D-alanyl-D-alanine endopeptidase (penicillin-binding protein 7)
MRIDLAVPALGWVLLDFLWQGLAVGAVAGCLLILMSDAGARSRYAICALALALCLGMPLMHLAWLLAGEGDLTSTVQAVAPPAWLDTMQARLHIVVTAWATGVGLMALRLIVGLAWVGRLRRHAVFAPAVWQGRLDTLALRMGLRRHVPLKLHAALSSPITVGFWRPVVLLPAALLSGMPVAMLEALLAHELAHVRRWDYLLNLLQSLVEALLFFHPVVWWLSARMRVEREQVADELAAQVLGDPRDLALALRELSRTASPASQPALILSSRGGPLLKRIERLLAPQPDTASWKLALPALLLACVTMLMQARTQTQTQTHSAAAPSQHRLAGAAATGPDAAPDAVVARLLRLPLNARHALVLDDGAGRILMAKDADTVVPIASLAKLMTAMVLLDARPDLDEKLRIVHADVDRFRQGSALLGVGSEVTRAAVLKLALMSSENRAAAALARTYPGGGAAFALALRDKIHKLGLTRTTITDPTGAAPGNTSTATEIARIVTAAARYPDIAGITSNKESSVAVDGRLRALHNTNPLVGGKGWDIRLSKTGSSDQAGSCVTMRMRSGDRNVTVVLLDADGPERRSRDAGSIRDSLVHGGADTD